MSDTDSDIEIVSTTCSTSTLPKPQADKPKKKLAQTDTIIELSDGSDDDVYMPDPYFANGGIPAVPINRTKSAPADFGFSSEPEELPDLDDYMSNFGRNKGKGKSKGTSAGSKKSSSVGAIGSTSREKEQSIVSKGKGRAIEPEGRDEIVSANASFSAASAPSKKRPLLPSESENGAAAPAKARKTTLSPSSKAAQAAADKAAKAALKEQESFLKQQHQEANKLIQGKKDESTKELSLHISGLAFSEDYDPYPLEKGKRKESKWKKISEDVKERMAKWKCTVEYPEDEKQHAGAEGALRWTRRCWRRWDDTRKVYVPLPLEDGDIIVEEDIRLIFITAHNLSRLISTSLLLKHIQSIQSRLPSHTQILLMIYGLPTLFRNMKTAEAAAHREEVRERLNNGDGGGGNVRPKQVGIGEGQPGRDEIELQLIKLQAAFTKLFMIQVDNEKEACDWIEQISFDVGQKPYVRSKMQHVSSLGLSDDKIISGKSLEDTYIKMLSSIKVVTEPVARSIVKTYPTLYSLLNAYERCGNDEKAKEEMLVGIQKESNKDGTATHRVIGRSLSRTIYEIFCTTDPDRFV